MPLSAPTIGTIQKPTKVLRPLPWQIAPWRDKSATLLLTGGAGGGKSHLALEKVNGFMLKYPGAFGLLIRKVRVSMTSGTSLFFEGEVAVSAAESIMSGARHLPSKSRFEYVNGSMVAYVGLEDRKQLQRLRSIGRKGGVDIVFLEEATEFDEADFNAVLARMRGRAAPWRQVLLACNPDAPQHWINTRLILGGEASVYYSMAQDNPHNPDDYLDTLGRLTGVDAKRLAKGLWVQAEGIIYDTWLDGPDGGNVTEAADYLPDGGPIYWGVDDGYSAGSRFDNGIDPQTRTWAADAHPRTIGFYQLRANGQLCRFEELYRVKTLEEAQVNEALSLGYPQPDYAAVDSSAAQLRGRLHMLGIATRKATHPVDEGIKEMRRWITPDDNGFRRLLVHPRCRHFRAEMPAYAYDDKDKPVKQYDHGPDEARYIAWCLRYET